MTRREMWPRAVKCGVCRRPAVLFAECPLVACCWFDKHAVLLDVLCLKCDEWFRGFLR